MTPYDICNIYLQCLGVSWYLSAEMQMFLFAPPFLMALWHMKRLFGDSAAIGASLLPSLAVTIAILAEAHINDWALSVAL